jgi:hypothetical protein
VDFLTADTERQRILAGRDPIANAMELGERLATDPEFYDALHAREIAPGIHINNPGPDPAKAAAKLISRAQAATAEYCDGMRNPRRNPVEAAKRGAGKWANRVQAAITNGSYEKGVGKQDYSEAVNTATGDGGAAYSAGVTKREAKIKRVFADIMPRAGAVSQAIQAMPQDTEAQREQRLLAARKMMIAVGKQRKGISAG